MKNIINSTTLRRQLDEVFDQVAGGKQITVTHRFKEPMLISALSSQLKSSPQEPLSGLKVFEEAPKTPIAKDQPDSAKELYHQHLRDKYEL